MYYSGSKALNVNPTVFDIELYQKSFYKDLGTLATNNAVINGDWVSVPNDRYWIITHIGVKHTYTGTSYHWYELSKGDATTHSYALAGNGSTLQSPALLYDKPLILHSGEKIRAKLWSATVGETGQFTARIIEVLL